jgi:beta-lactam-binding protein with PASTA domain
MCWEFAKATVQQSVVEVPDVRGKTTAEAEKEIRAAGFLPALTFESTGDAEGNASRVVIAQYPLHGQRVLQGTQIFLQFSPPRMRAAELSPIFHNKPKVQ